MDTMEKDVENKIDKITPAMKGSVDALQAYEKIIADACKNGKNINIPNSSFDHAYLGIKYLFHRASAGSIIKITSNEFYEDFWKTLKDELNEFMNKKGSVKLLLMKGDKNGLVEELMISHPDNFKVTVIDKLSSDLKAAPPPFYCN